MVIDDKYKSDQLFLLVGSNPLPNVVAGRLLLSDQGEITLIYSGATKQIKDQLCIWFNNNGINVAGAVDVSESDPVSIYRKITDRLNEKRPQRPGLHYTGGTKAMAVHAWQAVNQWARGNNLQKKTTFSYLNARNLEMVIDPEDPESSQESGRIRVDLAVKLKMADILKLHGLEAKHSGNDPVMPKTASALALACSGKSLKTWKDWVNDNLEECRKNGEWKNLPASLNKFTIEEVTNAFIQEGGRIENDLLPLDQQHFKKKKDFCKWLHGLWLEHHVLSEMKGIERHNNLHEIGWNIETSGLKFEVDIVAIRGYQLFGISCTTSGEQKLLKSKLFEAYVRMRQLGGEEARIGLVCCADDPKRIEDEMRKAVDNMGQIKVFGREDLPGIGARLSEWIKEQSGQGR